MSFLTRFISTVIFIVHTVKIEVQQIIPLLTTLSVAKRSEQGSPDK